MLGALLALAGCTLLGPGPIADGPCTVAPVNRAGEAVLPAGATDVVYEDIDEVSGPVSTLYPSYNLSTEAGYQQLNADPNLCPSLGGEVPVDTAPSVPGVDDPALTAAEMHAIEATLDAVAIGAGALPPLPPLRGDSLCGSSPCASMLPQGPFSGHDVILVHGLMPDALQERLATGPLPAWPVDAGDFMNPGGYWKSAAAQYWDVHRQQFWTPRGAQNRRLEVAWASTQRVEFAAHTMLAQIAAAMVTGQGVLLGNPGDPRGTDGFCVPRCIIISHSTGALVTDVAMALALNPALAGPLQPAFMGLGAILPRMSVHAALGGAFSGSTYATAVMAIALGVQTNAGLCAVANRYLERAATDPCTVLPLLQLSMLMDLVPARTQLRWGPVLSATPVPVLTVAGGSADHMHPYKRFFEPGYGDGVLSMDGACARSVPSVLWPSGFLSPTGTIHPWMLDRGMANGPARRYFAEASFEWTTAPGPSLPRIAAACTPFKTPWGMLVPVASLQYPLTAFYPNHHPLVQTREDHVADLLDRANPGLEDALTVFHPGIYGTLVSPALATLPEQRLKGKKVSFKLFGKPRTWYIWRRTYHHLGGWETRAAADYVYDYVR